MRFSMSGTGALNFTETSGTFKGLFVTLQVTDSSTAYNLETINLKVVRTGQYVVGTDILSGNLFALGSADSPGSYEGAPVGSAPVMRAFYVPFAGPVNLRQGEQLQVSASCTGTGNAAVTLITVQTVHAIGAVEYGHPSSIVYNMPTTQTNWSQGFGDGVRSITVVMSGRTWGITGLNGSSNLWQYDYDVAAFAALISDQFPNNAVPSYNKFCLFDNTDFPQDAFQLNATLDPTVLASENCYIVVHSLNFTPVSVGRAVQLDQKIAETNVVKFGAPSL